MSVFDPLRTLERPCQSSAVSDHLASYLSLVLGLGFGAYLLYGWRNGEIRAHGISRRSDGPLEWWSALLVVATLSAVCLMWEFMA